jgi:hypothetical protein
VKREPSVGQPSTAQIDFFANLFGTLQIMLPNAQQRADGPRKPRLGRRSKILLCGSLRCADLDATRTYYGVLVGSVASVAKVAALAIGNCVVEKIDDLAALATAS